MAYLTGTIDPWKFKRWLIFAGVDIALNAGIISIRGTDLMDKLKKIWPEAEIVPGIAAAGLIIALLAATLVILFRVQFFVEILQTADFAAVLYAFGSFKPAIFKLPGGPYIFIIVTILFVLGYLVAQIPFIKQINKSGTGIDKVFLFIILVGSLIIFVAPSLSLLFTS